MGHKWAENVYTAGLANAGITLSSRILGSTRRWLTNSPQFLPTRCVIIDVGTNTWTPYTQLTPFVVPGHPHFPYGIAVEPDAPL